MASVDDTVPSDVDTLVTAVATNAVELDTLASDVVVLARLVLSVPTEVAVFESEVETFVTAVAIDAVDEETLASDVSVLDRPVLS